jgi:hypothetical protein
VKQETTTSELLRVDEPEVRYSREGFFHCKRCRRVVTPSQAEVDKAENAPAGSLTELKCPHCHHRTVTWHYPAKPKPRRVQPVQVPVSQERAAAFFSELKASLS